MSSSKHKGREKEKGRGIGLYLHVPFCSHICHYCDFAKTARFDQQQVQGYFEHLAAQLHLLLPLLPSEYEIDTVFVGGGTPSLFTAEFEAWFSAFGTRLSRSVPAEITIEVNPLHATAQNLAAWRSLGFNRISLGVQSFDDRQLQALTRQHRRREALAAVERAKSAFANVSVDLIYGHPDQTGWTETITTAIDLEVDHLSMYTLTYEGNTVFNRRKNRKLIAERGDEDLAALYHQAMETACDYEHYEVSNWAKPGFASRHNQKYWQMADTLALGVSSHGFLSSLSPKGIASPGVRYSFSPKIPKAYDQPSSKELGQLASDDIATALGALGASLEYERSAEDYALETVLCSVRTARGVPISQLEQRLGRSFEPTALLAESIESGKAVYREGWLTFDPKEWYREYGWVHQVLASFGLS